MKPKGSVDVCPVNQEAWKARAEAKKADCGGESEYHCLTDRDGWKWEKCVQRTLILKGNCPIFTSDGYLDWKACNTSDSSCPNSTYVSNEVYKYSSCFGNNSASDQSDTRCPESTLHIPIIAVIIPFLFILGVVILIKQCCGKKRSRHLLFEEGLISFHPDGKDGKVKGVAKVFQVKDGVSTLLKEEVKTIVVKGNIGTSVFSTSSWILEKCAKKLKWKNRQCRYTEIPEVIEDRTILLVYGWFGLWNDNLCSKNMVEIACNSLVQMVEEKQKHVKIIFVMRKDLFKKYQDVFEKYGELFLNEICLDNTKTCKEYSTYLKRKVKGPCKNSLCACKLLTTEMIHKGRDEFVGMPLKLNIIANHHDLISNYIDHWDILEAMTNHIAELETKENTRVVFEWITYICLKSQFSRSEPFDEDLVERLDLEISRSSFDENDSLFQRYFRMRYSDQQNKVSSENARFVFWHPFIYICAFHFLYKKDKVTVMTYCNMDAVLEFVRPEGTTMSYIEVSADDQCVDLFNQRLRELGLVEKYKDHPLFRRS